MSLVISETSYGSSFNSADHVRLKPLSWGAILAGAVAALSAHLLISLFITGLGIQAINPVTDADPAKKFSIGLGIAWSVSALLSLWIGGWVAGRLTPEANRRLGPLHGILVWSVATVVVTLSVTSTAGLVVGGVAKLTGKAVATAGQSVKTAGDFATRFADQNSDLLGSFTQELSPPAGQDGSSGAKPKLDAKGTREISWALVRFFSLDKSERSGDARSALVDAVANNTGVNQADASRRVDEWSASYDQVQRDLKDMADRADRKAREAAKTASDYATWVAVWTFIAFVVGAISAAWGASRGAKCRREYDLSAPPQV